MVIGGLGRHVHHLATAWPRPGHDVVVLSRRPTGTDPSTHPSTDEVSEGVRVIAAAAGPARVRLRHRHDGLDAGDGPRDDPRRAGRWHRTGGPTSCTPTTGWSPTPPSPWPNSSTCHWFPRSTRPRPAGTPAGCRARISRQVHALESWLVRESDSLITCSASMREEITELFGPGLAEITVIRNGIDAAALAVRRARAAHAGPPGCSTSAGWSTRRACTTPSPRCRGSGAPIPAPR